MIGFSAALVVVTVAEGKVSIVSGRPRGQDDGGAVAMHPVRRQGSHAECRAVVAAPTDKVEAWATFVSVDADHSRHSSILAQ